LRGLPIPTPSKLDMQTVTNGAGAGKKSVIVPLPIIETSFDVIWRVGQQSQIHYNALYDYVSNV
jgi:predicted phosphoadenosine phosphosulfate sulfurtransferase